MKNGDLKKFPVRIVNQIAPACCWACEDGWRWLCADRPSIHQSLAGRPVLMAGTALRAAIKLASDMEAKALMPARISSLFLIALPSLPLRCFNSSRMRYSSLGMVKLSRTSFGFLVLSSFSAVGLEVVATAALAAVLAGALAVVFTATFAAALATGWGTGFGVALTTGLTTGLTAALTGTALGATALATGLTAAAAFLAGALTTFLAAALAATTGAAGVGDAGAALIAPG